MSVFYTSDTHFGHARIIDLCGRPFRDVEDMDAGLVERWNDTVKPSDTVYHLGDVTGGALSPLDNVSRLHGRKFLIAGNHDACSPLHREWHRALPRYLAAGFDAVMPFAKRRVAGVTFLMSHFPYTGDHTDEVRYAQFRLPNLGLPLVHGHTHRADQRVHTDQATLSIHVGVDAWDYTPVPEHAISDLLTRHEGATPND